MKTFSKLRSVLLTLLAITSIASHANTHDSRALSLDPLTEKKAIAPVLKGLGSLHVKVTTKSKASQQFFDQGLRLSYAFNHSEALRAFKEAVRLDPDNAMAYWGWALVLGPNINLPMVADVNSQAVRAIKAAQTLSANASIKERELIAALSQRYSPVETIDRAQLDSLYSKAMLRLADKYPQDADIVILTAAALMNQQPWDYWYADHSPKGNTVKVLQLLERVIKAQPKHPGALHYYIHSVEAHHPQKALAAADTLGALMPSAGHMVHMPSHIYMRVGRYNDAYTANLNASKADESYITQCGAQGIYPLAYYPHNVHFLTWAAASMGQSDNALVAARKVAKHVPADHGSDTWMLYQTFLGQPLYTLVRFGRWQEVLKEARPPHNAHYLNVVWHYARGLAYANTRQIRRARNELKRLRNTRLNPEIAEQFVGFNTMPLLMEIAENILAGEIAAKGERFDEAVAYLEKAKRIEDSLIYNEPPDWYFPVRHYLGAILLDAGLPREAEVVYWQDLLRNPKNGYALFGLMQSLKAQGKAQTLIEIRKRFKQAWAHADVKLSSSRF